MLSTWEVLSDEMMKYGRDNAMLSSAYPALGSVSQVNCSGADVQVVSCHCYLVVFYPFVEQLVNCLLVVCMCKLRNLRNL